MGGVEMMGRAGAVRASPTPLLMGGWIQYQRIEAGGQRQEGCDWECFGAVGCDIGREDLAFEVGGDGFSFVIIDRGRSEAAS